MRVGIVCEGRTDFILLEQVALAVFGPCVVDPLQPLRDQLDPARWDPAGWTLVKQWCEGRGAEGIVDEMALGGMDALVVQVDGDLCGRAGLPAERAALCRVIRRAWMGAETALPGVVVCIPTMSTDTWLLAALSDDPIPAGIEGDPAPVARLAALGVQKNQYDYRRHAPALGARVPAIRGALSELDRFAGKLAALRPRR